MNRNVRDDAVQDMPLNLSNTSFSNLVLLVVFLSKVSLAGE